MKTQVIFHDHKRNTSQDRKTEAPVRLSVFLYHLWRPEFPSSQNSCHSTHEANFIIGSVFTEFNCVRKIPFNNLQLNEVFLVSGKTSLSPLTLITLPAETSGTNQTACA